MYFNVAIKFRQHGIMFQMCKYSETSHAIKIFRWNPHQIQCCDDGPAFFDVKNDCGPLADV